MNPVNYIVENEFERIKALSEYDLDYTELQSEFEDLVRMAQIATGMPMTIINLMDADNVWVAAAYGQEPGCFDKEETVCQYTILEGQAIEIKDLQADPRSQNLQGVQFLNLRYYYGIPLKVSNGVTIGTLCTIGTASTPLTASQKELLHLMAEQVIKRLDDHKQLKIYKSKVQLLEHERRLLAHDIRGPLSGVTSLADLALSDGEENSKKELLGYLNLIKETSTSILEMAGDILDQELNAASQGDHWITLGELKEKIEHLFGSKIVNKGLHLQITLSENTAHLPFAKNVLLQVIGNLLSNAVKFTPAGGFIDIELNLRQGKKNLRLEIKMTDSGVGIDDETLNAILSGEAGSKEGTGGERGYGLGLQLVRQLVAEKKGTMLVSSKRGEGSCFQVFLPVIQSDPYKETPQ